MFEFHVELWTPTAFCTPFGVVDLAAPRLDGESIVEGPWYVHRFFLPEARSGPVVIAADLTGRLQAWFPRWALAFLSLAAALQFVSGYRSH